MADCVNALKEWTSKSTATIIYDSTVDEFTNDGLFNKVKGKPNIAVVGITTDGDVFGGFYSLVVWYQDQTVYDPNIFAFSFESHGRCETPQRFVVKEWFEDRAVVCFYKGHIHGFVVFWVSGAYCGFFLGNENLGSLCANMSTGFEGLEDTTLSGQSGVQSGPFHHCTRLIAIHLS